MLFILLSGMVLAICMISFEIIFLVLPWRNGFSFLPIVLRTLSIEVTLGLVFSIRKEPLSLLLICAGGVFLFIFVETTIVVFFRSKVRRENSIGFLIMPLSITRACMLVFVVSAGISAWIGVMIGIVGFFCFFPMQTVLQVYEYQQPIWKDFIATRYLLFKNRYYRMQGITWLETYREVKTLWRVAYRRWKDGYWFVGQAVVLVICILFSPLIALSSYIGWLLVNGVVHVV